MKTTRRGARRAAARQVQPTASPQVQATAHRVPPEHDEAMVTAPERPELRAPMRDDDPRARAAARAAELRDHLGGMEEGEDRFRVDASDVPDGWEYEWKRRTVFGKEDPAYQVQTARMGWDPVPASRHPHMMPTGWSGETIERDGMILMERPKEICDEARSIELKKARAQVRQKEAQLNAAPDGQFGRQKSDGSTLVKINKSFEPMPIPDA